ncbi:hypothetical protein AB4Z34_18125, partial [Ensifer sp. 2YAB10]
MSEVDQHPVLSVGLRHSARLVVAPLHTVPEIDDAWPGFRDMPPVFATAMMIAFVEETCVRGLRPYLGSVLNRDSGFCQIVIQGLGVGGLDEAAAVDLVERCGVGSDRAIVAART